jgi:phosphoglucosamine mutase
VREKQPLEQIPEVRDRIQEAESALQGKGRVVVRYSGTEVLARVMIEAESREEMEKHAERIAEAIRTTLGA